MSEQRTVPLGSLDPDFMLAMKAKYGLRNFVETGTSSGVTSKMAAAHFERVDTVEFAPDRVRYADVNLRGCANVTRHTGLSVDTLRKLDLTVPTFFWLDAHYCGGVKLGPECPILQELSAVGGTRGISVIVIDDYRLFANPPPPPHDPSEWPTYREIVELSAKLRPADWVYNRGDYIVIEPRNG